jgi:hypothetical protein
MVRFSLISIWQLVLCVHVFFFFFFLGVQIEDYLKLFYKDFMLSFVHLLELEVWVAIEDQYLRSAKLSIETGSHVHPLGWRRILFLGAPVLSLQVEDLFRLSWTISKWPPFTVTLPSWIWFVKAHGIIVGRVILDVIFGHVLLVSF